MGVLFPVYYIVVHMCMNVWVISYDYVRRNTCVQTITRLSRTAVKVELYIQAMTCIQV